MQKAQLAGSLFPLNVGCDSSDHLLVFLFMSSFLFISTTCFSASQPPRIHGNEHWKVQALNMSPNCSSLRHLA